MTAVDILALLAEDPALAVDVAAGLHGLRIAGPWSNPDFAGARFVCGDDRVAVEVCRGTFAGYADPRWAWRIGGEDDWTFSTDSKAARWDADAALVAAGWKLA